MAARRGFADRARLRCCAGRDLARRRRGLRPLRRPSAVPRRNPDERSVRIALAMSSQTGTKIALAIASGLALALAFPKFELNLLAWVAFVPLLYAVEDEPLSRVFRYAWLQGLA